MYSSTYYFSQCTGFKENDVGNKKNLPCVFFFFLKRYMFCYSVFCFRMHERHFHAISTAFSLLKHEVLEMDQL